MRLPISMIPIPLKHNALCRSVLLESGFENEPLSDEVSGYTFFPVSDVYSAHFMYPIVARR